MVDRETKYRKKSKKNLLPTEFIRRKFGFLFLSLKKNPPAQASTWVGGFRFSVDGAAGGGPRWVGEMCCMTKRLEVKQRKIVQQYQGEALI